MNTKLLTLLGLRIAALVLRDQGRGEEAAVLNALLRAIQAGRNVDAEMEKFADLLNTDIEPAMEALVADLSRETSEFLLRGTDGKITE